MPGFELLFDPPPQAAIVATARRIPASTIRLRHADRAPSPNFRRRSSRAKARSNSKPGTNSQTPGPLDAGQAGPLGGRLEAAVVTTVTVAALALVPFGVTDVGETLHVASEGAPEQASETA